MMYAELDHVLNINEVLPKRNVILLTDDFDADGSFVLQHFIIKYVKTKRKVLLVNNLHNFSHYHQICSKSGVNLKALREKKEFSNIDLLKRCYEEVISSESIFNLNNDVIEGYMKNLYCEIRDTCMSIKTEEEILIVIDNLSTFINIGIPLKDITNLFHYCCQMVSPTSKICLLARATMSIDDDDDLKFLNSLSHLADIKIKVSGLKSGYSREVNGTIQIEKEKKTDNKLYQYNFQNHKLKLFPYGSSSTML